GAAVIDGRDRLVMPGLVNAHAHLELTALEGLNYRGDFVDWIREVLKAKQGLEPQGQDLAMHEGILRTLRGGTTTIGDHLSPGSNPESLLLSPLRGRIFVEVLGVVPEVAADMYRAAKVLREECRSTPSRFEVIPSPHSVHALAPEILRKVLKEPASVHSIHLAESEPERRYFAEASGTMHDLIASRGEAIVRSAPSPILELEAEGLLDGRILAIHGNYLEQAEIRLMAERGIGVVHCPFSHAYFEHRDFPMKDYRTAGVNVALGTDSLASAKTLSMLEVLRETSRKFPGLDRGEIFAMATEGGAKALKMGASIGSLEAGKKADLIAVSQTGSAEESLFRADRVCFSMIDGEILTGF
ncbi:MAG: amidohydrolase family protein, partial [Deltaproteobacteria bacterium]|nr:amidohydrolase family protein [Deltaproteobacteria bacterium]